MIMEYKGFKIYEDNFTIIRFYASIKPSLYIYKDKTIKHWADKIKEVNTDDMLNQLVYYDNLADLKQDIDWIIINRPEEFI